MLEKSWSTLVVKSIDDESRIIKGVASTPSADRSGDIVEPHGAKFSLPFPFLAQHDHQSPIGEVYSAMVTDQGIEIEARIAKNSDLDYVEKTWKQIKSGLVRGLSIGFRPIKYKQIKGGGVHYTSYELFEISAVTVPANFQSNITNVKRFDSDPLSLEQMEKESTALPKIEKSKTPRLNKAKLTLIKLGIKKCH